MVCCGEEFVKDLRMMLLEDGLDALVDGLMLNHSDDAGDGDFSRV